MLERALWVAVVSGLGLLAGCSDDVAFPTSVEQCNRVDDKGSLPTFGFKSHWLDEQHGLNEAAEFYVCVQRPRAGTTVEAVELPEGVEVTPQRVGVDPRGNGIVRFEVRVSKGASGRIHLYVNLDESGGGTAPSPVVESDDDGWNLTDAD